MEARTVIALLGAAILVSGCTQIPGVESTPWSSQEDSKNDLRSNPVDGKGLEIKNMEVVDPTLRPGQTTYLTVTLQNYHISDTEIEGISIYNTGLLSANDDKTASCSPSSIRESSQGINPEMRCEFEITAPSNADLGGFDSKTVNPRIQITYSTSLTNSVDAYNLEFKRRDEITAASDVRKSYSNGEIKTVVSADQPIASDSGGSLDFSISPTSRGIVLEQAEGKLYQVNFESGASVLGQGDCGSSITVSDNGDVLPEPGKTADFSCRVAPEGEGSITQPMVFSVSYKYRISQSFNIEVINSNEA